MMRGAGDTHSPVGALHAQVVPGTTYFPSNIFSIFPFVGVEQCGGHWIEYKLASVALNKLLYLTNEFTAVPLPLWLLCLHS